MKIQLASDLHLELLEAVLPGDKLVSPAPDVDLLVLAGDIHKPERVIDLFGDWPVPVLFVAGNHEFYGRDWMATRQFLKTAFQGTSVTFLDNDVLHMGRVRFLGCTLWTDFQQRGYAQSSLMEQAGARLNDYFKIQNVDGTLQPQDTLNDHIASRAWLGDELERPFDGLTIVITHHAPHSLSIHPRHAGSLLNAGFASDLTPLLHKADLWLHGHVHDSFDYRIGGCRVVANPAGYCLNGKSVVEMSAVRLENQFFRDHLVLDADIAVRTGG
ncbi:MAG: metallophosphoesterase [Hylemonella sp.]|nr:metallophosphoesterase [Hylemonella sp.]MDP1936682.1 metallophosphoesterase [Hylemonella sp.]